MGIFWLLLDLLKELVGGGWNRVLNSDDRAQSSNTRSDAEIAALAEKADRPGLVGILAQARDAARKLDAAEALAQLADDRGLDYLIDCLDSSNVDERYLATEIIAGLNVPRGNGALQSHPAQSSAPTFGGDTARQQIFSELNLRETEELAGIWEDHDAAQWREEAFEVIAEILRQRLGQVPARSTQGQPEVPEGAALPDGMHPRIKEMWTSGDFKGLKRVLDYEGDWMLRLDAAEALARSGHTDGLQYLIGALDSSDADERDVATEILQGLNDPRGNLEWRAHQPTAQATYPRAEHDPQVDAQDFPSQAASPGDVWAAYREKQTALRAAFTDRAPGARGERQSPVPVPGTGTMRVSRSKRTLPIVVTGALGGVVGMLTANLRFYLVGQLPPLQAPGGGWAVMVPALCLPLSLVAGVALAGPGNLVGQSVARALRWRAGSRDPLPLVTTFLAGAIGCLVINIPLISLANAGS